MFFVGLAFIIGAFFARLFGVMARECFVGHERNKSVIMGVIASVATLALLMGAPLLVFQLLHPIANDSNRMIIGSEEEEILAVYPGISVINSVFSGSKSDSCNGKVIRSQDNELQVIGVFGACARPGDDFDIVEIIEGERSEAIVRVESYADPQCCTYGWFSFTFKEGEWKDEISYKKAIIEVPKGEVLDLNDLAHE